MTNIEEFIRICAIGNLNDLNNFCREYNDIFEFNRVLYWPCLMAKTEFVYYLVNCGAGNFYMGFIGACEARNYELIKFMIEKGANITDVFKVVCFREDFTLLSYLVTASYPALNGNYFLARACEVGKVGPVRYLMSAFGFKDFSGCWFCIQNNKDLRKLIKPTQTDKLRAILNK